MPRIESKELVLGRYHPITWAGDVMVTAGTGTTCRIAVSGAARGVTAGIGSTYLIAGDSSTVWRWNQHSVGASVRPGGPFAGPPCSKLRRSGGPQRRAPAPLPKLRLMRRNAWHDS